MIQRRFVPQCGPDFNHRKKCSAISSDLLYHSLISAIRRANTMKELNLRNITMMAAVASWFIQIGAQLFALSVVASTVSAAPPRSFAILAGEYRYDSSAFWEMSPPIVFATFLIALIANWTTRRRKLMLFALAIFVAQALLMMFVVEPEFHELISIGYRDEIDRALQSRAAKWYAFDWLGWTIGAIGGVALLLAFGRPASTLSERDPSREETRSSL